MRWKPSGDTWKGPTCSGLSFCAVLYASTGWVVARRRCLHEDPEHQGPHSGQAFSRQPLPLLPDAPPSSSIFATMGSFTAPSASCCGSSYMFVVLPGGLPTATGVPYPQRFSRWKHRLLSPHTATETPIFRKCGVKSETVDPNPFFDNKTAGRESVKPGSGRQSINLSRTSGIAIH